jgi:wyosine [tRNA(Phe)-imidazoG37] synthetase (radical SAM superfamily)
LEKKLTEGVAPDYISLAGSGEPTLHTNIGELIREIKLLTSVPVAVLTNGSLLWMSEVQDALLDADLVLPSLDAGDESLFQHVNRPHPDISFDRMVNGLIEFRKRFFGEVWLELFLLAGVTGIASEVRKMAALAERIGSDRIDLNTISRPPAEEFACPVPLTQMEDLARLCKGKVGIICQGARPQGAAVEIAAEEDILGLLSRRPCTLADIASGLGIHATAVTKCLDSLTAARKVQTVFRTGQWFYMAAPRESRGGVGACN